MVHLYVFNPVHKLRLLAKMWFRKSKPLLASDSQTGTTTRSAVQGYTLAPATSSQKVSYRQLLPFASPSKNPVDACRDLDYYRPDSEGRFCIFLVENTLFRVHRCYLAREPSVFADMLSLPQTPDCLDGSSDRTAIPLFDTAEQFRDLLWALYAPPSRLCLYSKHYQDELPIERLLNIAEMAIKYCITSYEEWAMERIHQLAQEPDSFLRKGSPTLCSRVLDVAVLSGHQELLRIAQQRLVCRVLWSQVDFLPLREVAEHHNLRRLRGVAYYKELVNVENAWRKDSASPSAPAPDFASIHDPWGRKAMRRAHRSLVSLCRELPNRVPKLGDNSCPLHTECKEAWRAAWVNAFNEVQIYEDTADVLGRLKAIMIHLRKSLPQTNGISISCTLTAIEAISTMRDRIIDELLDHFVCVD